MPTTVPAASRSAQVRSAPQAPPSCGAPTRDRRTAAGGHRRPSAPARHGRWGTARSPSGPQDQETSIVRRPPGPPVARTLRCPVRAAVVPVGGPPSQ
jgi:hypothetical protein